MKTKSNNKHKAKIRNLDNKISQIAREVELLYLIMEHQNVSEYDLDSELASAKFQLENILSMVSSTNNDILLDILKQKQAT